MAGAIAFSIADLRKQKGSLRGNPDSMHKCPCSNASLFFMLIRPMTVRLSKNAVQRYSNGVFCASAGIDAHLLTLD
jgi:hypothetical protein